MISAGAKRGRPRDQGSDRQAGLLMARHRQDDTDGNTLQEKGGKTRLSQDRTTRRTDTDGSGALSDGQIQSITQSQRQWVAIIDAITDYIFVLDEDERIVKANSSFAQMVGRHPRELAGVPLRDALGDERAGEVLSRQATDGRALTYEKAIGEDLFQISVFWLQEADETLAIHIMKNITEVKRLKDQLYYSDKLASIGLLVSGVAHEINNPLTGTIAYTELLQMKVQDENVLKDLKKIRDSAERCKKIVENLLTFSRQRAPSKSLESINALIDRVIDLRSYWLRSNNILVDRQYDGNTSVFVDGQQIQQVILNILMNAEQAITGAGLRDGKVIFTTRLDRERKSVLLSIENNGPAIPQRVLARIFDPFFTTKPVGVGTGLGLSISHGIISEHGGSIAADNAGSGVVFTIELPTGAAGSPGTGGGS